MKKVILLLAGVLTLAVLAGAAFVAGGMLQRQAQPTEGGEGGKMMTTGGGGGDKVTVNLQVEPAPEVSALGPPLFKAGAFVRRSDNSIFVGTGQVKMMMKMDQTGKVSTDSEFDGPVVEVVVTHDTIVYRDVTMKQFDGNPTGEKMKQVIEPGSLDELGDGSMVQVWGTRNGDRAAASTIVYSLPAVLKKP